MKNANDLIVYADLPSERTLLGAMLVDPSCIPLVNSKLGGDDFADPQLGKVFHRLVMLHAAGKPLHELSYMTSQVPSMGLGADGFAILAKLFSDAPSSAKDAIYFAENIAEKARLRKADLLRTKLNLAMAEPDVTADKIASLLDAERVLMHCGRKQEAKNIGELYAGTIERLSTCTQSNSGLKLGIDSLDNVVGPLMPGTITVIAARPGVGKTSLVWQTARSNAMAGKRVLVVSLEMPADELLTRDICQQAGVNQATIRFFGADEQDKKKFQAIAKRDANLPLMLYCPYAATLADIAAEARYLKHTEGIDLICIDYVGLIKSDPSDKGKPRWEAIGTISRQIKALSKELGCATLMLCQLNREAANGPAHLGMLRDSGSIEQDADCAILLDNPTLRNPAENQPADPKSVPVTADVAKNRHGPTGIVNLLWHPKRQQFSDPKPPANRNADLDNYSNC